MSSRNDFEVHHLVDDLHFSKPESGLNDHLAVLFAAKWRILSITLLSVFVGGLFVLTARPVYMADALLQVEVTSDAFDSLGQVSFLVEGFEDMTAASAEAAILRSRMVLGKAVDALHLDISAEPVYFPLIGEAIARWHDPGQGLARPWFGLSEYAWGGEEIRIDELEVPYEYVGKRLTLIAEEEGRYRLLGPEHELVLEGQVGQQPEVDGNAEQVIALSISALAARPGTTFEVTKKSRLFTIQSLQKGLNVEKIGEKTGILEIRLEGPDPVRATTIINHIADFYVRQNIERKSGEAAQVLAFLEQQLPVLKEQMETAEMALIAYRLQQGSVDLSKETQVILEKSVALSAQLTEVEQKRERLLQSYTSAHPMIMAINSQIAFLNKEIDGLTAGIRRLPGTEREVLSLSRDVQVNTELYSSLLNSIHLLRVSKAGTIGAIRVVDYAVPPDEPVKPQEAWILAASLLVGLFLGAGLAFVREALFDRIDNPDSLEKRLGLPVYATIPHSKKQAKLDKRRYRVKSPPLAKIAPSDLAIEGLRSLYTALRIGTGQAEDNTILIMGASPGVGKSFVCANLATVLASADKRVLLIDADLRYGKLNHFFDSSHQQGLSEFISATTTIEQSVHSTDISGLDFIPTGALPLNPFELLLHERFAAGLDKFASFYDYVIIDSPPVLMATDAAIVGRLSHSALMVVRAGKHSFRHVEHSVKRLRQAGVEPRGFIFNDVKYIKPYYDVSAGYPGRVAHRKERFTNKLYLARSKVSLFEGLEVQGQ